MEPSMILADTDVISHFQTAGELRLMMTIVEESLGVAYEVLGELGDWTEHGDTARSILDQAVEDGLITQVRLERQELSAYSELRRRLGRGEAASVAIAAMRGYAVATDDRAACRICSKMRPPIRVLGTERLLECAVGRGRLAAEVAEAIWDRMAVDDPRRGLRLGNVKK